jgi:hypothetical protein
MRKNSTLFTILVTSFVMALSGLVAGSVASASENVTATTSLRFSTGSSALTSGHKAAITKAVNTSGKDATFIVTGTAGKLPGASDKAVQLLARKRGEVVKAYLVKLGVSASSITTNVKITRIGIVPRTKLVGTFAGATPEPTPSTSPTASNSPTPSPSPTLALTCATGGACVVGDPGPGGGIVYYVDNAGFSCGASYSSTGSPTGGLCNYLEVAPSGWNTDGDAGNLVWAVAMKQHADVSGIDDDTYPADNNAAGIGLGFKNSELIVAQGNDITTAAGAARAYAGGSKTDWYLPTATELNLLCQWNRGVTQVVTTKCSGGTLNSGTGATNSGFVGSSYWSSSEEDATWAWLQSFNNGNQGDNWKNGTIYVRPVRAF